MTAKGRYPVRKVFLHPCYTVGYGSKDHCNMPFYGVVCALYGEGRPVRIANDRYEQFQTSLKRHAFDMRFRIGVDRKTTKQRPRSEEHTSELQSLMRISYAVFCLKNKNNNNTTDTYLKNTRE